MPRTLTNIATDCKNICGATIVQLGRLQELDGARNAGAVLDHIAEAQAGLRSMTREMDLLATRYQAILVRKAER